ncbi:MAG: hypothetical protein IIX41_07910 [Bacteroidales bacterium]|nr:hypothetical protein [Bacteroidales bacterium]
MALFDAGRVLGGNFATILALFGAESWRRRGFASGMAFFGAEMVPGGNFATILTLFGAELRRRQGFATEMALFGAEMVLWPTAAKAPASLAAVEAGELALCQIVGKIDLVSYLNGKGCEMFIYC